MLHKALSNRLCLVTLSYISTCPEYNVAPTIPEVRDENITDSSHKTLSKPL